jgi:hypothetical protein
MRHVNFVDVAGALLGAGVGFDPLRSTAEKKSADSRPLTAHSISGREYISKDKDKGERTYWIPEMAYST